MTSLSYRRIGKHIVGVKIKSEVSGVRIALPEHSKHYMGGNGLFCIYSKSLIARKIALSCSKGSDFATSRSTYHQKPLKYVS